MDSIQGYVTKLKKYVYEGYDNTFYYISETVNSFKGVATREPDSNKDPHNFSGTYNCLAYSVGITDRWQWAWYGYPTKNDIEKYMKGTGRTDGWTFNYVRTSYNPYTTKVIYYEGGHFAKVIDYYSNGEPKRIISKWASGELIESSSSAPFNNYGKPVYYID